MITKQQIYELLNDRRDLQSEEVERHFREFAERVARLPEVKPVLVVQEYLYAAD